MLQNKQYVQNWAKNITYSSNVVHIPSNIDELKKLMVNPRIRRIKVQGTGHSFNRIADTFVDGAFVSLKKFMDVKVEGDQVHFGAGLTYSDLIVAVDRAGKALMNVPSLPHVNVVGSMVTATHGSGFSKPLLIDYVTGITIIFANGTVKRLSREDTRDFHLYIMNFGSIGIITSMSMKVFPPFKIFKAIYQNLSWDELKNDQKFDDFMKKPDYLSLFCTWESRSMSSVWCAYSYTSDLECPKFEPTLYGAQHIKEQRIHPVPSNDPSPCVTVGSGLWKDKIYHFLPDQPPSSAGDEIHTEYFIPYKHFREAIEALYLIRNSFKHLVQVSEFRMVAADNIPLSPAKGQPMIAVHWTWFKKHDEISEVLPLIEQTLMKFNPKPHFGKHFILSGPKFHELFGDDLQRLKILVKKLDPNHKFKNSFIRTYFEDSPKPKL